MPQVKPVSEPQVKRVVIGVGQDKKSAVTARVNDFETGAHEV
jgi:hypothetical protein